MSKAERELLAREKRVHKQHLHPLPENERIQFAADWRNVQTRFVDEPSAAVQNANELIKAVMVACSFTTTGKQRNPCRIRCRCLRARSAAVPRFTVARCSLRPRRRPEAAPLDPG